MNFFLVSLLILSLSAVNAFEAPSTTLHDDKTGFPSSCSKAADWLAKEKSASIEKLKTCTVWKNEDKVKLNIVLIQEDANRTIHCDILEILGNGTSNNKYRIERDNCIKFVGIQTVFDDTTGFPDNCRKAADWFAEEMRASNKTLETCGVWKNEDRLHLDITLTKDKTNHEMKIIPTTYHCRAIEIPGKGIYKFNRRWYQKCTQN